MANRDSNLNHSVCSIIPPHILSHIAREGSEHQKVCALRTLACTEQLRGRRITLGGMRFLSADAHMEKNRLVYDAHGRQTLPGVLIRKESAAKSADAVVNEAYDGSGDVYDFYRKVYGRNSVDSQGLTLKSTVHYGKKYDNAFWNGSQMVYGDGDGNLFGKNSLEQKAVQKAWKTVGV